MDLRQNSINPIELVLPYLNELFEYCVRSGEIADTWNNATLMLILKEDREWAYHGSYSPISLLNVDYEILANIMAERLNKITGGYVIDDQTGFIRGRWLTDNIRKIMNIMAKVQEEWIPAVF